MYSRTVREICFFAPATIVLASNWLSADPNNAVNKCINETGRLLTLGLFFHLAWQKMEDGLAMLVAPKRAENSTAVPFRTYEERLDMSYRFSSALTLGAACIAAQMGRAASGPQNVSSMMNVLDNFTR